MPTLLVKTEPDTYSFSDLVRDGRTVWEGVKNPAALIAIRSAKNGDQVLIYHTGKEKAVVGLAKVVSAGAYEDPKQPGRNARGEPLNAVIDLEPVKASARPLTLSAIKADPAFAELALVKQSRLSVMALSKADAARLQKLAKL